jgi:hypothetical protein
MKEEGRRKKEDIDGLCVNTIFGVDRKKKK